MDEGTGKPPKPTSPPTATAGKMAPRVLFKATKPLIPEGLAKAPAANGLSKNVETLASKLKKSSIGGGGAALPASAPKQEAEPWRPDTPEGQEAQQLIERIQSGAFAETSAPGPSPQQVLQVRDVF